MEGEQPDDLVSNEESSPPQESQPSDPASLSASTNSTSNDQSSFGHFLYNHNPFYLISCLLVIYGCQSLALSGGSLLDQSLSMAGGIASYTFLMAMVCIGVVKLAKIWDDARSIFIVVVISLIALTTAYDELCIADQSLSTGFSLVALGMVVMTTELVLRFCGMRLAFWYRLSYYAYFLVLTATPVLLGHAVSERHDALANWGSLLFSIAIAATMLLLIPATRQWTDSVVDNGTPWTWPLYPLSAFAVMWVLAGIRAHAIWISFGFFGVAGNFEPFLLLPLFAAIIVLIAETGLARRHQTLQRFAFFATPLILLCASTKPSTLLPISNDIRVYAGSSITITLLLITMIYSWMWIRGVKHSWMGVPATLFAAGFLATLPQAATAVGLQHWMLPATAVVILLVIAPWHLRGEWFWISVAATAASTIAMCGESYGYRMEGLIIASVFAITSMLAIGAVFESGLATFLRYLSAGLLFLGTAFILSHSINSLKSVWLYSVPSCAGMILFYGVWIRRRAWLMLGALQLCCFIALWGYRGHRSGHLDRINWPIASGLICLSVGVAITTGKTGAYRRLVDRKPDEKSILFRPGF